MSTDAHLSLGSRLRILREERGAPLRVVAAQLEMDSTLLSKIELGARLPTQAQAAGLARYYGLDANELEAQRLIAEFWTKNLDNPAAPLAAQLLHEEAARYGRKRG